MPHQAQADFAQHAVDDIVAVLFECGHGTLQHGIAARMQGFERQILQFAVHMVQPEPVGNRRVHFQRFGGDAHAAALAFRAQRPHIVQPVGQLDNDDAHVFGHSQNQLAETFGLLLGFVVVFQVFQFGQPVHHFGDGVAELFRHFAFGNVRVFQHIVHQPGAQCLNVHVPFGQFGGHGDGVGDIRFAAFARLPVVCTEGVGTGFFQQPAFFVGEVGGLAEQEFARGGGDGVVGQGSWNDGHGGFFERDGAGK